MQLFFRIMSANFHVGFYKGDNADKDYIAANSTIWHGVCLKRYKKAKIFKIYDI